MRIYKHKNLSLNKNQHGKSQRELWSNPVMASDLQNTVIPLFTSLIRSSKTARKTKTRKTKINFREKAREEGACISENWKTGINLCISYSRKLVNRLLVYRGIIVFDPMAFRLRNCLTRLYMQCVMRTFPSWTMVLKLHSYPQAKREDKPNESPTHNR
jgi:hypothetical protein